MRSRKVTVSTEKSEPQASSDGSQQSTAEVKEEALNTATAADVAEAAGLDEPAGAAPASVEVTELRKQIEDLQRTVAEKQDLYLRTLADLDNFRRRSRQEQEDARRFGTQDLILKLLPVVDNFERALNAASEAKSFESLAEGVALILKQFQEVLKGAGVEAIEAQGQPFDPNLHEAILQAPVTEEYPENTVVQEVQKGYSLHGRVIRPSLVQVAKA